MKEKLMIWQILPLLFYVGVYAGNGRVTNARAQFLRNSSIDQLSDWKNVNPSPSCITTSFGTPVDSSTATLTIGPRGPILLQDFQFIDAITNFDRERIPERVVHAKGGGALGYFEVTHDISQYTRAVIFSKIGKRTNMTVRFSTTSGESGASDTVGDVRGFALKFYTEEGIWDLVGNNWPVFWLRDPMLFPSFIHVQKRNPVTHLHDANMLWDFLTLRTETTYQLMLRFTDAGIPDGFRHTKGHGIHTFKFVNAKNEGVWCKFHYIPDQGVKNMTVDRARKLAASDPDYAIRDLYDAIQRKEYPSWTFYVQIMTFEEAAKYKYNPFDPTKEWPQSLYPYKQVGRFVLVQNAENYFAHIEQAAFSPSHLIPGIEPSPDKLLHGRMFSYPDTQLHRLGPNHLQLPINRPYRVRKSNYERDGAQTFYDQDGAPNYFPNSFNGPKECPKAEIQSFDLEGVVERYDDSHETDFDQPRILWREVLNNDERTRLVKNMADSLKGAYDFIQQRALKNFANVDVTFSERLKEELLAAKTNQGI